MDPIQPYALLETRSPGRAYESLFFDAPVDSVACEVGDNPSALFDRVEDALRRGYWLCGYFSYEFGYLLEPKLHALLERRAPAGPLAWVGVFNAPASDSRADRWRERLAQVASPDDAYAIENMRLTVSREDYYAAVAQIKAHLSEGETYQTNYTHKCRFRLRGSPPALYGALRRRQPVPYSACLHDGERTVLSLSPELFFRYDGDTITSIPMKGTARRGRTVLEDESIMAWLASDAKNRAENVMIVDMVRNDLGRIAAPGGVSVPRLFDIERYRTLLQMTSTVTARVQDRPSWQALFGALFPSASITGAPKVRTMQLIADLEREPRGVYTGAIGYIAPDGHACFSVAIRTAVIERDGHAEMGIGSGIVIDSDAAAEYDECLLKARFLTDEVPSFELVETMLCEGGRVAALEAHMQRLGASARYFGYDFPSERIRKQVADACARSGGQRSKMRLLLNEGGRVTVESQSVDAAPAVITLRVSRDRTDAIDAFLYHKTTHRPLYERERAASNGGEVIFLNTQGEVTEGTITNIFARSDGRLLTPPISSGLLAGTLRQRMLDDGECEERVLRLEDLVQADELFVGNAVMGLCRAELVVDAAGGPLKLELDEKLHHERGEHRVDQEDHDPVRLPDQKRV